MDKHDDRVVGPGEFADEISGAAHLAQNIWKEMSPPIRQPFEQIGQFAINFSNELQHSENHWYSKAGNKPGVEQIHLRASLNVTAEEFARQNPDRGSPEKLIGRDGFNLRHATTGQVDANWRLDGINKDGSLKLSKEYQFDVQSKNDHSGLIEALPGVPEPHIKALQKKIDELPPNVLRALSDKGYKILATTVNTAAIPELKGLTPRGWPKDMDFDNSDGTHDNARRVILAPYRFNNGQDFAPVDRENVVVHQIGHALDHAFGKLSNQPEFQDAFKKDMADLAQKGFAMTAREKMIYDYFNQKEGPAKGERPGSEECFASLFGSLLTGPENPEDKAPFQKNFQRTIAAVSKQIQKLK